MKLKKLLLAVMVGNCFMTSNAFAGEWKTSPSGWWYQNDDGTYLADGWQWIDEKYYYFNKDGYMAANTWIDNYYVGEDGAWIPDMTIVYPTADYFYLMKNDMVILYPEGGFIKGELSDVIDHGNYYEIKNQQIYAVKQYNTKAEAAAEPDFDGDFFTVGRLSNGKYAIFGPNDWIVNELVYFGSIYINKDVKVDYYDRWNSSDATITLDEYMTQIEEIGMHYGNGRSIGANILGIDEKGYVSHLEVTMIDYLP